MSGSVPPGTYERGNNCVQKVIQPALLEVNGLSDTGVDVTIVRRSPRAFHHGRHRRVVEEGGL